MRRFIVICEFRTDDDVRRDLSSSVYDILWRMSEVRPLTVARSTWIAVLTKGSEPKELRDTILRAMIRQYPTTERLLKIVDVSVVLVDRAHQAPFCLHSQPPF